MSTRIVRIQSALVVLTLLTAVSVVVVYYLDHTIDPRLVTLAYMWFALYAILDVVLVRRKYSLWPSPHRAAQVVRSTGIAVLLTLSVAFGLLGLYGEVITFPASVLYGAAIASIILVEGLSRRARNRFCEKVGPRA